MIAGLSELLDVTLACAVEAVDPIPGRVLLAPGAEVAWDSCCDGQLWVRVVSVQDASELTGVVRRADGSCPTSVWEVGLGVGVLRCSPSVDDRGRAPSASALSENAAQIAQDMLALSRALLCCAELPRPRGLSWTPLGPEGGCAGGEWTFSVRLPACACEEG